MTLADWLAGRQSASLYVTPRPVIGQHPAPTLRRQAFSCYRPALGRAGRAGGGVERAFSPLESWLSFTQVTQKSIDRGGRVEATDIPVSRQRPPILLTRRGCEVVSCGAGHWTPGWRWVAGRQQLGLGTAAAQRALHWLTCTVASPSVAWPAGTTMPATTTHHRVLWWLVQISCHSTSPRPTRPPPSQPWTLTWAPTRWAQCTPPSEDGDQIKGKRRTHNWEWFHDRFSRPDLWFFRLVWLCPASGGSVAVTAAGLREDLFRKSSAPHASWLGNHDSCTELLQLVNCNFGGHIASTNIFSEFKRVQIFFRRHLNF